MKRKTRRITVNESRLGVEFIADLISDCQSAKLECIVDDSDAKVYVYDKANSRFAGTDYLPDDELTIRDVVDEPELMMDASGDEFKQFAVDWNSLQRKEEADEVFKTDGCMPIHGNFTESGNIDGASEDEVTIRWMIDDRELGIVSGEEETVVFDNEDITTFDDFVKEVQIALNRGYRGMWFEYDEEFVIVDEDRWLKKYGYSEFSESGNGCMPIHGNFNESKEVEGTMSDKDDLEDALHEVYISDTVRDDILNDEETVNKAIGHHVVGYAYTDYGGDEFDRLVCDYVKAHKELPAFYETTSYNGANCVIIGELADKIVEAKGDLYEIASAIGFDLEFAMEEFEEKLIDEELSSTMEEIKDNFGVDLTEDNIKWIRYWLEDHARTTATMLDYSTRELFDAFEAEQMESDWNPPEMDEATDDKDGENRGEGVGRVDDEDEDDGSEDDEDVKYRWVCSGDGGGFTDKSNRVFDTQEECYEDMMEHAIDKMKWNVEWDDVTSDSDTYEEDGLVKSDGEMKPNGETDGSTWGVCYRLECHPHMIQHYSYSGLYTYEIEVVKPGEKA